MSSFRVQYYILGEVGGVVTGKQKSWTLGYADDLVLLAKTEEEIK